MTAYADTTKASEIMGWNAKRTLRYALKDCWKWEKNNRILG